MYQPGILGSIERNSVALLCYGALGFAGGLAVGCGEAGKPAPAPTPITPVSPAHPVWAANPIKELPNRKLSRGEMDNISILSGDNSPIIGSEVHSIGRFATAHSNDVVISANKHLPALGLQDFENTVAAAENFATTSKEVTFSIRTNKGDKLSLTYDFAPTPEKKHYFIATKAFDNENPAFTTYFTPRRKFTLSVLGAVKGADSDPRSTVAEEGVGTEACQATTQAYSAPTYDIIAFTTFVKSAFPKEKPQSLRADIGQEDLCNSVGIAISSAKNGLSYQEYIADNTDLVSHLREKLIVFLNPKIVTKSEYLEFARTPYSHTR